MSASWRSGLDAQHEFFRVCPMLLKKSLGLIGES
jgi:hypothetical protein